MLIDDVEGVEESNVIVLVKVGEGLSAPVPVNITAIKTLLKRSLMGYTTPDQVRCSIIVLSAYACNSVFI